MISNNVSVELRAREISRKYDRFARWEDWIEGVTDVKNDLPVALKGRKKILDEKS